MPQFDSILFDFDGVLADTEPLHCACWAEVLAPFGIRLDWQDYLRRFVGIDDREVLRTLGAETDPPVEWAELWKLYPAKKALFRERVVATPPFDAALGPFLTTLGASYKLAVVSSSSCAEIEPLMVAGGIRQHFQTVVGGENVSHHKPAPDPYLLAAERLQLRAPLVVEDSEPGLASGRAAGFEVLRVTHPSQMPRIVSCYLAV